MAKKIRIAYVICAIWGIYLHRQDDRLCLTYTLDNAIKYSSYKSAFTENRRLRALMSRDPLIFKCVFVNGELVKKIKEEFHGKES